jgi:LacI family transcriptional regulator
LTLSHTIRFALQSRSGVLRQPSAGVSVTTVSHALSGNRPVSPATAQRIRRLIDDFGYAPDAGSARLRSGRSRTIELVVPDIAHWYFGRIAKGVEEAANAADYGLVVASTADADPRREKRYFNMLRTRAVDGMVYAASRTATELGELITLARAAPVVLADEAPAALAGVPSVTSTVGDGARAVARHLRELGHTSAVALAGTGGLPSVEERIRAFREVLPNALTLHGDFDIESGYRMMSDLLANRVPFSCVVAHNDFMAVGAMRRLAEEGLRVPEDVSVVGFDDADIATVVTPALTTVRKDMVATGRRAAELLLARLEGEQTVPTSEVLPVELVIRQSTGPAAVPGPGRRSTGR